MNSPDNVSSPEPMASSSLRMPKTRASTDTQSMISSTSTLPYRASNTSVSSLFASTTTPTGSRAGSPSGGSRTRMSGSVFGGTPTGERQQLAPAEQPGDPRTLILQAFVPHIAVHTSSDTHELIKDKGISGGLWELLRPFGERVQGNVTVRDSVGAGKTYQDFSVRFVQLGDGLEPPDVPDQKSQEGRGLQNGEKPDLIAATQRSRTGGNIQQVETLVDRHLSYAENFTSGGEDYLTFKDTQFREQNSVSPFYTLYLRRLLSGIPLTPHETWAHPVACIIAISSRNPSPIEALRSLYQESTVGPKRLPQWVNSEYLRYYVLVHDEERDNITKSMALFDQMKKHFGLHCHLLRLRSSNCVSSDDDSTQLPRCEWVSASEELADIQSRENEEDIESSYPCIYESDVTAINTFIREMVTQSVVPSIERCVSTWNDQVASRRRGLGGRFISLSKKWTGFGGGSRSSSGSSSTSSSSNYDSLQGFYRPDAPEAIMRKLADYAFMLRDWKLAQSTYDILRSDFNNDKAWRYHAGANEMSAISTLLIPQNISSKSRIETIDQWLETASYSYITRCGASYGALRCLTLGMELLRLRGGSATEDAAKWGIKMLGFKVVGVIGDALLRERVAVCYASKKGTGSGSWGARMRKSALWTILAADAWLTLGKPQQSKQRLDEVPVKYSSLPNPDSLAGFVHANKFLQGLQKEAQQALYPESAIEGTANMEDLIETSIGEESEDFVSRPHRRSLMGATGPAMASLGSAPLNGTEEVGQERESPSLQFE